MKVLFAVLAALASGGPVARTCQYEYDASTLRPEDDATRADCSTALLSQSRVIWVGSIAAEPTLEESTNDGAATNVARPRLSESVHAMSESQLWWHVKRHDASLADKVSAMYELAEREPPALTDYLLGQLAHDGLNVTWRCALLLAAERAPVRTASKASELCEALVAQTLELNREIHADTRPAIWAALRRVGSLAEASLLGKLVPLLDSNDARTRQATLQAVAVIARATAVGGPPELEARVNSLVDKYLDKDWLVSGANVALAANAVRSAIALRGESRGELARRVRELNRPALERLCRDALAEA